MIDFILCTRNRSDNILGLINSINSLDRCDLAEVTIVDSSDIPLDLNLEKYSKIGKINLIHSTPGLPTQRNLGLSMTHNSIVVFLDDDVLLESNFIVATLSEFDTHSSLGGLGYILKGVKFTPMRILRGFSISIKVKEYGQVTKSGKNYWYPEIADKRDFKSPMWLPGCAMAFRREQIEHLKFNSILEKGILGGYALGEDVDFTLGMYSAGKYLGLCSSTMVNHYEAPGERDNFIRLAKAQGDWLKYLTKEHRGRVLKTWVLSRLLAEYVYLLAITFIFRGTPTARICSRERLFNFLRPGSHYTNS